VKLLDRVWVAGNKRKPSRWAFYLSIIFTSVLCGVYLILGCLLFSSNLPWLGGLVVFLTILCLALAVYYDYKYGYVEVIYKHSVERWTEKRKKLGVK
jgi:hypothetical protein